MRVSSVCPSRDVRDRRSSPPRGGPLPAVLAHRPSAARLAAGRRRRRVRPFRRRVPGVRDARRRQDDLRAARRPPDALRGARGARRGGRADHPHLPPVGARRRALRHRPRAQPARTPPGRSRATATASRSPTRRSRPGPAVHRRRCAERADAADRRRAAPHGRGRRRGGARRSTRSRARASGCCSRARRSARTTRRSRGSTYDDDGVSRADYDYGYTQALIDGVCRPVTFHTYGGDMEWVSDGTRPPRRLRRRAARRRGRAAAAHRAGPGRRLDRPRAARRRRRSCARCAPASIPDAGGLVVAIDKEHAEQARRPARADHRRAAGHRALRRAGRLGADRALLRRRRRRGSCRC